MSDEERDRPTDPATPLAKIEAYQSKSGQWYAAKPAEANDAVLRYEIAALLRRMTEAEARSDRLAAEIRELRSAARAPQNVRLETVALDGGDPRVEK
jgi:hypothetical protein